MTMLMVMKMMVIVWLRALPVSIVAPSACLATRKAEEHCWQELGIGAKTFKVKYWSQKVKVQNSTENLKLDIELKSLLCLC